MEPYAKKDMALLYSGQCALFVFYAADMAGYLLNRKHDILFHAMSELVGMNAPHKVLIVSLLSVFTLLFLYFSYAVGSIFKGARFSLAVIMMRLMGMAGLFAVIYYPTDMQGTVPTFNGYMHIALGSVMFASALFIMILFGTDPDLGKHRPDFRTYSLASAFMLFGFELLLVFSALTGGYYFGLFERISMFLFLQWIFVVSLLASGGMQPVRFLKRVGMVGTMLLTTYLAAGVWIKPFMSSLL